MSLARRPAPGQAIIEFALVLPLMLLITLGAVDVGRVFFDYIGIRAAAMEGAIYGSRNPEASNAAIEQRVRDHFLPDSPPPGLTVTPNVDSQCKGLNIVDPDGFVTVAASREFEPLSLAALQLVGPGTDWEFTVRSTARTRCMT